MTDLILFELKKMLRRRVSLVASAGILALLCAIMALNVVQTKAQTDDSTVLSGLDAIAYTREGAQAHAGVLPAERVQADLAAYRDIAYSEIDSEEVADLSDAAAYDLFTRTYDQETFGAITDPYYTWLLTPWRESGQEPYQTIALLTDDDTARFYDAAAALVQETLDGGMGGSWEYSEAERAYWTEKQFQVEEPLSYGYAGGWEDILNCLAFLAFAMVAICIVVTPVFASEYQERTDSVLLASRYGRTRLVAAKIVASLAFATAYFALCASVICGVALAAFGADGADLPVQVLALRAPYDLTMAQAAGIGVGLAYVMTLGFTALTLALSSCLRSVLSIFAIDVALIFLTGLIPTGGNGILLHALYLSPLSALVPNPLLTDCVSYPLGGFVTDLQGACLALYGIVALACIPMAVLAWRRHQVA